MVINALPALSVGLLQSSASLQGLVMALLRGEKTHETLWQEILTWLPKKILEKVKQNGQK